jgi:hypothetical protein
MGLFFFWYIKIYYGYLEKENAVKQVDLFPWGLIPSGAVKTGDTEDLFLRICQISMSSIPPLLAARRFIVSFECLSKKQRFFKIDSRYDSNILKNRVTRNNIQTYGDTNP